MIDFSTSKLDAEHIWHPCSQMHDYEMHPSIPIAKANGVWLYPEEGEPILDAISSWWVNIFGHCHPEIVSAIQSQSATLDQIIFANYTHNPAARLARNLSSLFSDALPRIFFVDNGSAAIEVCLKMSYHYHQLTGHSKRRKFVYLSSAYHGETLGALAVGSLGLYKKIYQPLLMDTNEVSGPDCYRCILNKDRSNCQAECFSLFEQRLYQQIDKPETVAAIIAEPLLQCAGGMLIYPSVFLKKLDHFCKEFGIHFICDEIATGFGRTGSMMASHQAQIIPDFVAVSKGLTTGSLPLAAVLTNETIYQAFYGPYSENRAFMHSHSYSGNPIACAAANAVFSLFQSTNILSTIKKKKEYILSNLNRLSDHPHVGEIRSIGLVVAIELVADRQSKKPFDSRHRLGYQIYRWAEKHGLLLRNLGDTIYFMPPLIINEKEIDIMTNVAVDAIWAILPHRA